MRLNTIHPAKGAHRERVRVGRGIGSGLGKTAGRGHKGQLARAGKGKVKAGFEGGQMPLQRRLPKVGFSSRKADQSQQVMLYRLEAIKSAVIDLPTLLKAGLVDKRARRVKIVKKGEITRPVKISGILTTAGAKAAIEAAGGSVE